MNFEQPLLPFYSIGHSTRPLEEFVALLEEHGIVTLADIRRFPGSRRHPHFTGASLSDSLRALGIAYLHIEALGGHRKSSPDSPNLAWRNASFRGYADHMASPEFKNGVERLLQAEGPVCFMCAESVPWRCHRNLLSDEIVRCGGEVLHILGPGSVRIHQMNPAAVDAGDRLVYREPSLLF